MEARRGLRSIIQEQQRVSRLSGISMEYTDQMIPNEFQLLTDGLSEDLKEEGGSGTEPLMPGLMGRARIR